jgi:hypothetical protein
MQDKHLVIVHFNEDRDKMINKLKYPYTVIHKGNNPQAGDIIHPNIGKDCYSYLKYIVDFYDELHEYTIFTQADPDDHVHEFLIAIDCPFTAGYGSFGYARSVYTQYGQGYEVTLPNKQFLRAAGINFKNDSNMAKFMFYVNPGCVFYAHRDRIRQRPKSFYEKLMEYVHLDQIYNLIFEENYPAYVWNNLDNMFPQFKNLDKLEKLKATQKDHLDVWYYNDLGNHGHFGALMEGVLPTIFMSLQQLEKLNISQASIGNKFNFNLSGSNFEIGPCSLDPMKAKQNFQKLENDAFDWSSSEYKLWREKLIEKTAWEGEQRNFDYKRLLDYYDQIGYKHITL